MYSWLKEAAAVGYPQPALHDFLPDADSDTDDIEPLPEDEDAVDVVPAAPADDAP